MPQPIVVVDAFTDRPFAGNPAAVCVMNAPRDERWMQLVAREMNLSETAFVLPPGVPTAPWRWLISSSSARVKAPDGARPACAGRCHFTPPGGGGAETCG